ncbi:hypothetical protein L9F63_005140, partial [Diploptera punctata]
ADIHPMLVAVLKDALGCFITCSTRLSSLIAILIVNINKFIAFNFENTLSFEEPRLYKFFYYAYLTIISLFNKTSSLLHNYPLSHMHFILHVITKKKKKLVLLKNGHCWFRYLFIHLHNIRKWTDLLNMETYLMLLKYINTTRTY